MRRNHAKRARVRAAAVVGALVGVGTALALQAGSGSNWADLGLAIVSGGIVGGALVLVEGMLAGAADQRSAESSLRMQLTSATELNGIDLSDENLAGFYLPGKDLVAAKLSHTSLGGALLYYADLRFADLRSADLRGADLSGCTLRGADLTDARLAGAILNDADLRGARFDDADLRGCMLVSVRASEASFLGAQMTDVVIKDANLEGADLRGNGLKESQLGPVQWSATTVWPERFAPPASAGVSDRDLSELGLAEYLALRHSLRD